jgi:uncharacterized protein (TIGR02145 family)
MKKYKQNYMKIVLILFVLTIVPFISCPQAKSVGQVVDIDNNIYNTIIIGDQVWLKENLKVTRFSNGDQVQLITDTVAWSARTTPAYCNYNNSESIAQEYGRLYNYYTVIDKRNLCPAGWHVPDDTEWETLSVFLGGTKVAGGKMKEAGTRRWRSPNVMSIDTTNGDISEIPVDDSGFSALPSGRQYHDTYAFLGEYTQMWSTTQSDFDVDLVWCRYLTFSLPHLSRFTYKRHYGLSVRCLKD